MNKKFENKIALITGGNRGLGKNTALNLAGYGCDIILTYNTNGAEAEGVISEIESMGQKAASLRLDVRDKNAFPDFTQSVKQLLKEKWDTESFDFLVNNAGVSSYSMIEDTSEESFDNTLNIHFKGVLFLTQILLPMISDHGRIVNFSTGLTRFTFPGYGVYAAVKGAIEVFTRYLAKELGTRGITVNSVAPGAIDNDFNKHAFEANPQVKEMIAQQTALGRVGVSEDIGGVVAFLCTPDSGWINGQRIEVSGGMFL